MASSDIGRPVLMSAIAGSATGIGACIVYFTGIPSDRQVSLALSYAAGVMVCVSVIDLYLPMASKSLQSFALASVCAGIGALLCRLLGQIRVPEPEELLLMVGSSMIARPTGQDGHKIQDDGSDGPGAVALFRGVSSTSPRKNDECGSNESSGSGSTGTIDDSHMLLEEGGDRQRRDSSASAAPTESQRFSAWRVGILLAIILTAHNLPEGLAVAAGAQKSHELGLALCAAIFLHNVAEGAVIAIPLLRGLPDRRIAVGIAALTGLSEPLGALIGVLVLSRWVEPSSIELAVDVALACVAGIMADVSVRELLPLSLRHAKEEGVRLVATGFVVGAVTIGATLAFV